MLIILLIVIGSKAIYKDNFAILTGTITGDGTDSPSMHMNYPEKFNRDNCVVLSVNLQRKENGNKGYGAVYDSSSYVTGSIPSKVVLGETDVSIEIRNVLLSEESGVHTPDFSADVNYEYTIVLMKIGD